MPAGVEVSQAKAFANEKCEAVVRQSQVIHGGIGFMMEFDLHLWLQKGVGLDHATGNHFRPPRQDRQRPAGQAGQECASASHYPA